MRTCDSCLYWNQSARLHRHVSSQTNNVRHYEMRPSASHVEGRSTAASKRKSGGVVRGNRAKSSESGMRIANETPKVAMFWSDKNGRGKIQRP